MTLLARAWHRLDPRRRLAARLLLALFLAFALPGAVLVLLLERRLSTLQEASRSRVAAARLAQETMRLQQDAQIRADGMDRGARVAEEAAWSFAAAAQVALSREGPAASASDLPPADAHGHVWNAAPEAASLGYLPAARSRDRHARRDLLRSQALEPSMEGVRQRLPAIRRVSLWTASGAVRISPWLDLHEGIRQSGGAAESFMFNRQARFPEQRPSDGDRAVWTAAFAGPTMTPEARFVSLFTPVRGSGGELLAAVAFDVDPRRYVAQAVDRGGLPGDIWFALDGRGHALVMPGTAGELLRWRGEDLETLGDSTDPERLRLAGAVLSGSTFAGTYRFRGKNHRFAAARANTTGWVFVEGLSEERLAAIVADPDPSEDAKVSDLRRDVAVLFGLLLLLVLGSVLWASRRISAPILRLMRAAEEMGRGREVEVAGQDSRDEFGRLAAAIDRMGRRVERRVETLHRLHGLLRAVHPTSDLAQVQARATEAIAAFTGAERVWFFFHDPDTNRLTAAWPGWNLPQELARDLTVSVDRPSIASMVFKTGEIHVSNDLDRDPYSNRKLQALENASNAIFAPLKTEGKAIGVVVATNRPGGFGPEEADALTMFAEAASLLIRNARLYATLTGTVTELQRANRLKDHFLQNVNHELRTPLTSIVGWTDLFEDDPIEPQTLQRGLRQIRQSSRLLLALIDDLLDLARLDRGTLTLEWKAVAIEDIVARTIETVRLMAEARGVTLLQAPLPDDMPAVRADPLRLQQILWNLTVNAIKFTPRYGRVIVRIEREPERYLVSVEDDGVGIPESELPHVFERFRQVDGSATRQHPGMGIGLSLARNLVELHGGTIWAESTVGQGSRFTFSLPIRPWRRSSEAEVALAFEEEDGAEP
jgi:signal transduction histidine kinase/HAMP domain-containing protein